MAGNRSTIGVIKNNICYLAHPVFSIYSAFGTVALKDYVIKTVKEFLGKPMLCANLPSTARVSLMKKNSENCFVLHLLYANPIKRGGEMDVETDYSGKTNSIEVIEDLLPIHNIDVELKIENTIKSVTLQPQNKAVTFTQKNGLLTFKVEKLLCHQMIELLKNG